MKESQAIRDAANALIDWLLGEFAMRLLVSDPNPPTKGILLYRAPKQWIDSVAIVSRNDGN